MRKLILALALISCAQAAYLKQRTLTVDHTKVGSSHQTNFPFLVCANGVTHCAATIANLADSGHGGLIQHTTTISLVGQSTRTMTVPADLVISSTGCSAPTLMKWELEGYDNTTGTITIWINGPDISNTVDTIYYMCYDNSSVTTWQGNVTGTWPNYYYVNHGADGSTAYLYDSSSTGAIIGSGTAPNTNTAGSQAPPIGMGLGNGVIDTVSSNGHTTTSFASLGPTTTTILEAWVLYFTNPGGTQHVVLGNFYITNDFNILMLTETGATFSAFVSKAGFAGEHANAATFDQNWHHQLIVCDGVAQAVSLYIDGVLAQTTAYGTTTKTASTASLGLSVGGYWDGSSNHNGFLGRTDEYRVGNFTPNSFADYATSSFNSTNNPSTFVTIGAETGPTGGRLLHKVSLAGVTPPVWPAAIVLVGFLAAAKRRTLWQRTQTKRCR